MVKAKGTSDASTRLVSLKVHIRTSEVEGGQTAKLSRQLSEMGVTFCCRSLSLPSTDIPRKVELDLCKFHPRERARQCFGFSAKLHPKKTTSPKADRESEHEVTERREIWNAGDMTSNPKLTMKESSSRRFGRRGVISSWESLGLMRTKIKALRIRIQAGDCYCSIIKMWAGAGNRLSSGPFSRS